ncbi:MAG TPA: DUF1622 domain-containing protein [Pirellulales bacterium]|jgi:uncharacterized membrane protein|nr:DUF1622 domain-containing protein [Pirellulales bacterium]
MTAYLYAANVLLADVTQPISVNSLLNAVVPLVSLVGVGAILWGAYSTAVRQVTTEAALARGKPLPESAVQPLRFAFYLGLGLEFMIAAAAIKTLITPDLQQVGVLGGMVIIRAMVGLYPRLEKYKLPAALPAPAPEFASPTAAAQSLNMAQETVPANPAPQTVSTAQFS